MHSQIQVQSLKKYSAKIFTNALETVQFLSYNIFNVAHSEILNKILDIIDNVAPIK